MELLIIWILTIIASVVMELSSELRIFKDVADNGYKIDVKKISELASQINPNASKVTLMSLLIPVVNIMGVFQRTMIYNNVRHMILDQLSVLDSLIPMTKEEEEEYKKNPSAFNAIYINARKQTQSSSESISYTENNEKNTIWFRRENDKFIVIKAEGPISKLSIIEQRGKLIEKMNIFTKKLDMNALVKELENQNGQKEIYIDLDEKEETANHDANNEQLSRQEKIESLENLKNDLIVDKANERKSQDTNNSQKLMTKRKK
jgi:uncharacterized protein YbcV (DUF1398 family)